MPQSRYKREESECIERDTERVCVYLLYRYYVSFQIDEFHELRQKNIIEPQMLSFARSTHV